MGTSLRILIGVGAIACALVVAMALDSRGFRQWRRLGQDVQVMEAKNAALANEIAIMQRKVEALRGGPQALERPAHENGYVHADEMLFELK